MSSSRLPEPSFYSTTTTREPTQERAEDGSGGQERGRSDLGSARTNTFDQPTVDGPPAASAGAAGAGADDAVRRADRGARLRERVEVLAHTRSWTLRSKLVVSMVVLFTAITLLTGAATTYALRGTLYTQLDDQLTGSVGRPGGLINYSCNDTGRGPGDEGLIAFQSYDGAVLQGCTTENRQRVQLTSAQLTTIFGLGNINQPTTVAIEGSGTYRLVAAQVQNSSGPYGTIVVGLPTEQADRTIARMVALAVASVLGGLILVALFGTLIVRRTLRPLDRVASTATRVAQLPLDRGQVALAERVPSADTDLRTEVGQVGFALNEMLDHIDEALQSRQQSEERVRQFVADASHELRTPLASIRGYAELTRKERDPVPPTVTHAIGRIESEGKRMSSLVEDLLLLARLDAGRPLESDTVDLTEMVVNAVSDAHAAAPDHTWRLDLPDEPIEVRGDSARLHQIVANLLANARTHTDPGTVVRTSLSHEQGRVRISVQDNGPGVPVELQANVFQRFARGDTSRNRAGGSTGLGLSIVAAVVQAHGGTVELQSRPGDTRFSVLLPA